MKIQNMAIIFLVITIPLILILAYYINLQRDTLELQAEYDLKLLEATKEGIRAYEVNTVDWATYTSTSERKQIDAMINGFITSLANKLNIAGTAKEYMLSYIPAITITMYDGYYIYSPSKVPINCENKDGVQLYLGTDNKPTLDPGAENNNKILYKSTAANGTEYRYLLKDEDNNILEDTKFYATTDASKAETEWKYILNNKIAYTDIATGKNNLNVVVNYTLDNRLYIYGTQNNNYVEKDGYLVYFGDDTRLPRISMQNNKLKTVEYPVLNVIYQNSDDYKTVIEPEVLQEQIVFRNSINSAYAIGTFKYLYDINNQKVYYDDSTERFFVLNENNVRNFASENAKVGQDGCWYKSVSVLLGTSNNTTEFKKVYRVLNGEEAGSWYISSGESTSANGRATEIIDTKLTDEQIHNLCLNYKNDEYEVDYTPIYLDYSAINYYVESYAFTNWVAENKLKVKEGSETLLDFKVTKSNDPEKETSAIVQRKREVIKDSINKNLNQAISNYGRNTKGQFKLPVLTESDWDQMLKNVSLITFVQGIPIGVKSYNNYAIATSTMNKAFVEPSEIYYTTSDNDKEIDRYYHRVFCKQTKDVDYTGYRGVEFVLQEFKITKENSAFYYLHDNYANTNNTDGEISCYHCIVNKANYKKINSTDSNAQVRNYKQAKAYNEAVARERYFQKEVLEGKLGVKVTYHVNLNDSTVIQSFTYPNELWKQNGIKEIECENGTLHEIQGDIPTINYVNGTNTTYTFKLSWNTSPNGTGTRYNVGQNINVTQNIHLYAEWTKEVNENVTITYNANLYPDGISVRTVTLAAEADTCQKGNSYTIRNAPTVTYFSTPETYYEFNGWQDSESGIVYYPGANIVASKDMTLIAQWESNEQGGNDDPGGEIGPWYICYHYWLDSNGNFVDGYYQAYDKDYDTSYMDRFFWIFVEGPIESPYVLEQRLNELNGTNNYP